MAERLDVIKLSKAAELAGEGISETLSYYAFPQKHGRRIRANKPLERTQCIDGPATILTDPRTVALGSQLSRLGCAYGGFAALSQAGARKKSRRAG